MIFMTKTTRQALAGLALLPVLALTGCGDDDTTPREGPVSSEPSNASATPSATGSSTPSVGPMDPSQALAKGGLSLPSNTSGVKAERIDVTSMQWLDGYRVSFSAPRSNALQICQQSGLTGDIPSTRLTEADQELLGTDVQHVDGMRKCSGLWPDNSAWQRVAVISPGDPATVHVAIAQMGR